MAITRRSNGKKAGLLAILAALGGCGTYVPEIADPGTSAKTSELENRIKTRIYCELGKAISKYNGVKYSRNGKNADVLPDDWGALLTIYLQVDESLNLSPGAAYNNPFKSLVNSGNSVSRYFEAAFGLNINSETTRIDKYTIFYSVQQLKQFDRELSTTCNDSREGSSFLLSSNLKISDWLDGALAFRTTLPSAPVPDSSADKQEVMSYEIKFVVTTTASATPSFKLMKFSGNTSGSLAAVSRVRTHDLLLTLGPSAPALKNISTNAPGVLLLNSHYASEYGISTATGVRSGLRP